MIIYVGKSSKIIFCNSRVITLFLTIFLALNKFHQLSYLVSIFQKVSVVMCILNILSLFLVTHYIHLRLWACQGLGVASLHFVSSQVKSRLLYKKGLKAS